MGGSEYGGHRGGHRVRKGGESGGPCAEGGHGRTGWPGGACTRSIKPRVPSGPRATRCIGASFSSRRLALHTRTAAMLTDESRPMGGFILLENRVLAGLRCCRRCHDRRRCHSVLGCLQG